MRPEAGRAAVVALEEAGPGLGQAQQPQRVAGRRGVEDDVVEAGARRRRAGRRTRRRRRSRWCRRRRAARAPWRAPPRGCRPRIGASTRCAVGLGRGLRIDVHRDEARHARAPAAGLSASATPSISSRFEAGSVLTSSTRLPGVGQGDGGGAGERGLADAALAGEEQERGGWRGDREVGQGRPPPRPSAASGAMGRIPPGALRSAQRLQAERDALAAADAQRDDAALAARRAASNAAAAWSAPRRWRRSDGRARWRRPRR